jgi:hypothetical protein
LAAVLAVDSRELAKATTSNARELFLGNDRDVVSVD